MNVADIVSSPWAITPAMFSEIQAIYARHARGERVDLATLEERAGKKFANGRSDLRVENGVAIVALQGVLAKRMNLFMQISGGTSTQIAGDQLAAAAADPSVHTILLHIDSPGGTVDGTEELANQVAAARSRKRVIALADGSMMSAAYWIGSAADRVLISSGTTLTGSIGVVATHIDVSKREEMMGVKTTEITAGKYKRIASEHEPLSKDGRAYLQSHVDALYSVFVDAVAKNRGRSVEQILEKMADGRTFVGRQAIDAGLVDGVASFGEILRGSFTERSATSIRATAPHAREGDSVDDPVSVAMRAREYQAEQAALGRKISAADAVNHVLGEERAADTPIALAERAMMFQAQQAKLGVTVNTLEAIEHVTREAQGQ